LTGIILGLLTATALLLTGSLLGLHDWDHDFGLRARALVRERFSHRSYAIEPEKPLGDQFVFLDLENRAHGAAPNAYQQSPPRVLPPPTLAWRLLQRRRPVSRWPGMLALRPAGALPCNAVRIGL